MVLKMEHNLSQRFNSTHYYCSLLVTKMPLLPSSTYLSRSHSISSFSASKCSGANFCCSCVLRFYSNNLLLKCYCIANLVDYLNCDLLQLNQLGLAWVFLRERLHLTLEHSFHLYFVNCLVLSLTMAEPSKNELPFHFLWFSNLSPDVFMLMELEFDSKMDWSLYCLVLLRALSYDCQLCVTSVWLGEHFTIDPVLED